MMIIVGTSFMLEPMQMPPHRSGVIRWPALLAVTVALATVPSPMVAMAGGSAVGVVAAPDATAPNTASGPVRIDVEPTIDGANLLPGWILERNPSVAEKIPPVEGHEQWIAVKIGGSTYDYRVSVMAMRDDAPLGTVKEPEVCECNSETLLEMVDARIVIAAEELRASAPEPEPTTLEQAPAPTPRGTKADNARWRPGRIGYTGVGLGVLGVALVAGGVPLALRDDELRGEPGTLSSYSTRLPGIGMAVGGGVAIAGGIVLVVVDFVQHRKSTMAILPTFGPREAGVFITRRF